MTSQESRLVEIIEGFSDFYDNYKNIDPPKSFTTIVQEYVSSLLNSDIQSNGASQEKPDSSTSAGNKKEEIDLVKYFRDCMEGGQSVYNRSQRKFIEKTQSLLKEKEDEIARLIHVLDTVQEQQQLRDEKIKEYKALAEACFPYIQELQAENYTDQSAGVFKDSKLEEIYNILKQPT